VLMNKLGKKHLTVHLQTELDSIPAELTSYQLTCRPTEKNSSTPSMRKGTTLESLL